VEEEEQAMATTAAAQRSPEELARLGLEFLESLDRYAGLERRWLVRLPDETTSPEYGTLPWERPIEQHVRLGVIPLDKPPGPTSHEVVAWVKRMFGLTKAGHGGTLDPKVTGVLPVALEEATKVIGLVVHTGKEYMCVMQLHRPVPEEDLRRVLGLFVGEIYQRPPLRSSVKRALRTKRIYEIDLLEYNGRYALMRVYSEAGTYMRKLCHDAGLILGVGSHMRELRRTKSGPFREERGLVRLQDLSEALYRWRSEGKEDLLRKYVLPVEYAVAHLPKIVIRDTAVDAIAHGANLAVPGIVRLHDGIEKGDLVALFTLKGELVAVGVAQMSSKEIMEARRGIAVKIRRVVMKPGVYPAAWRRREKQEAKEEEPGKKQEETKERRAEAEGRPREKSPRRGRPARGPARRRGPVGRGGRGGRRGPRGRPGGRRGGPGRP
jgi:H/ACA ribonucleoprotein complex subunit 4